VKIISGNGCGYAAVEGGYGIVSADHIKFIPKLKHIYENRYKGGRQFCSVNALAALAVFLFRRT
jgi:hypothetical protein